ncbi:hypothetical protein ACFV2N_03435 [Streptomyces sp. NPDC059680]|uniref:hypothetical protein n=1 Tax=Streptomyces sp. NPDC059680 TaxID=3346904 RepID=UPI00367AC1AB
MPNQTTNRHGPIRSDDRSASRSPTPPPQPTPRRTPPPARPSRRRRVRRQRTQRAQDSGTGELPHEPTRRPHTGDQSHAHADDHAPDGIDPPHHPPQPTRRDPPATCDTNDRLLTADLTTFRATGTDEAGRDPDVHAHDTSADRLFVAAESGWVPTADNRNRHPTVTGRARLADGAHVVAVDPTTHRYYPVPDGSDGHPALHVRRPAARMLR